MLVLDFDGTVCLGDGPVWSYAEAAIAAMPSERAGADEMLREALAQFLTGTADAQARGPYLDGYAAVASLASTHLDAAGLTDAYHASRAALARGEVEVTAAAGLADLLTEAGAETVVNRLTDVPKIAEAFAMWDGVGD